MAEKKKHAPVERVAPAPDKKKALETAMMQIEKNHGKGSIMRLGEAARINGQAVSTGAMYVDVA